MRRFGAFEVETDVYAVHERPTDAGGVEVDGVRRTGWPTPSGKLEWYSKTMADWSWEDEAFPSYMRSHVYWRDLDLAGDERILVPTFRLPTLIHTRSGNAKYLYEISHGHPLWMHPGDGEALGFETDDLVRINTDIGYFVMRVWRTKGIRPGVVAASHHLGRWRVEKDAGNDRWSSALVDIEDLGGGTWRLRHKQGTEPFESDDPDSSRVWWRDPGVNQNLAFGTHPDPASGMHAWHQRVRLTLPGRGTATATSSSTPTAVGRCTGIGSRWRDRVPVPTAPAARDGFTDR